MYDMSAIGMWRNANEILKDEDLSDKEKNYYKDIRNNAVASGLMAVGAGINGILNPSLQAAEIGDTTAQRARIADVSHLGEGNYYDYDQLGADYANANFNIGNISSNDIRGLSTKEKIGSIGSAGLAGASAGMQVAGPWGALAGGVIGVGSSLLGIASGNRKEEREAINLNNQADIAQQYAQQNFAAAFEQVADRKNRQAQVNIAAQGGSIHIKKENEGKFTAAAKSHHMSVQEFAKHVLAKQNANKYSATMRKRANFARNAAKWHAEGGYLYGDGGELMK